jgi:DNA repair ATPase RecN
VNPDIAALVEVQTDDLAIHELERGIDQLMPRVNALNAEVAKAKTSLDQATQQAEAEEKRKRDVLGRIDAHKQLQSKNEAVYSAATNQKEATAATAQLEQVKKIIGDEADYRVSRAGGGSPGTGGGAGEAARRSEGGDRR